MFYRRKIVLALLELSGGTMEKLRLQKLLFLYSTEKPQAEYDFVPYKYGCYSYSLTADMNVMVKNGLVKEIEKRYIKLDNNNYFNSIIPNDRALLKKIFSKYGKMKNHELIRHTYLSFPFFAIHSNIAEDVLGRDLYDLVNKAKPSENTTALFTIGYEGISLEKYFQKLIRNNIKLLVDVRRNPLSMKFGFSKSLLKKYCESLRIEYLHIPEVGIESGKRKSLHSQKDYDDLFENYRLTTLKITKPIQEKIFYLLLKYNRIALTCFEAYPEKCHRKHLAQAIESHPKFHYQIIHL